MQTTAVLLLVVPTTWAIAQFYYLYLRGGPSAESGGVVRFMTLLSAAETLAFCPLLFAPIAAALRRLNNAKARLERLADTDALTGLNNRRGLDKAAARLIAAAAGRGDTVAALVCDVDHFKRVNDLYGHSVGDETLRSLGRLLTERFADDKATAARVGGEEFVALVAVRNPRTAETAADGLRRAFAEREVALPGAILRCTLSVGVAAATAPCALEPLVRRADAALYRAKAAGRNRIATADATARNAA